MRHGGGRRFLRSRRIWLHGAACCCLGSATLSVAAEPHAALTGHISSGSLAPLGPNTLRPVPRAERLAANPPSLDAMPDPPAFEPTDTRGATTISVFDVPHSEGMELVAQEADAHTRRGFELAGRRAYFSAREEFIQALRTLSQSLDVQQGVDAYSSALAAGMRALDEADDFVPRGASLEANLNVPMLVSAHATPVYRFEPVEGVSPLVARQRYYTYAREQLGVCVGRELAGSMALHGLGKLHAALAAEQHERLGSIEAEAMVYYQAALLASPQNHMAANDLGTLLASKGSWAEARNLFLQSLESQETPTAWNNLAKAHRHLGEVELAVKAAREAQLASSATAPKPAAGAPSTAVRIEWVEPKSMTAAANEQFLNNRSAPPPAPAATPATAPDESPRAARSWWPWKSAAPTQ